MKMMRGFIPGFCLLCAGLPCALAEQAVDGDTLTIDGEIVSVGSDADLGAGVTNVVLTNEGGVRFTNSVTSLKKNFRIDGTGVVSVDAGRTVYTDSTNRLVAGTLGQTLVKRGPGSLQLRGGPKKVTVPTHWIVEEGEIYEIGDDYFGNHSGTTTNLTVAVREGAVFRTDGRHCPMGPLELTGGTMNREGNSVDGSWGNTAFRGGVLVHACARESRILINGNAHLNHVYTNVPFVVESGATLVVRGRLSNGYNANANARIPNRLEVSGGGNLRLFSKSVYTGGTKVSDGTTVTLAHAEALGTGPLEIDGEVTLEILPGATYACPGIGGTGKIVKTGKGVMTYGSLPADVTFEEREPGTMGGANPIADGQLHLNGSSVVVSVAAGETLTIDGFVDAAGSESAATEIVKTGEGTLVLPEGSATCYGKLTVQGGYVAVGGEGSFGSGVVTLQGGGLRIVSSFNQQRSRVVRAD